MQITLQLYKVFPRFSSSFHGATVPSGLELPHRGFTITLWQTHTHTHSVRFLWTSDRTDPENFLTTHDAQGRQISMPRRDSNPQSQQVSSLRPKPLERAATVIEVIPCYKPFLANTTYCTLNVSFWYGSSDVTSTLPAIHAEIYVPSHLLFIWVTCTLHFTLTACPRHLASARLTFSNLHLCRRRLGRGVRGKGG
jgi:hypothetical protein